MKVRANHAVTCAAAVGGAVLALATPAAAREAGHLINGTSIQEHSVPGNRLENNTITGRQVKESTLGVVPNSARLGGRPAASYERSAVWAYVEPDGTIRAQSGGISLTYHSNALPGSYYLTFPSSLAGHPISVTPHYDQTGSAIGLISAGMCGDPSGSNAPANGEIECTVGGNTNREAFILTENSNGATTQEGFYVRVG
jgi:hypothetical protein